MIPPERQSDYYDSEFLADYYESFWNGHPSLKDIDVYWKYFKDHVLFREGAESFALLDVGTGTGRVIHSLVQRSADDASVDISKIQFVGIDKSQFMLDCACKLKPMSESVNVSWLFSDATSLDQLIPSNSKIDLLVFAFSSINHLHQPGEIDRFFRCLPKVLKPGGLALVSVCTSLLDTELETYVDNPFGEVKEVKSKFKEGILYREWGCGQSIQGDLFINSMKTEVVQIGTDGSEQVIESNSHNIPLRLVTRKQLNRSMSNSGLGLLNEILVGEEVIFVMEFKGNSTVRIG